MATMKEIFQIFIIIIDPAVAFVCWIIRLKHRFECKEHGLKFYRISKYYNHIIENDGFKPNCNGELNEKNK